jgi:hypothetical protein
MIHRPQPEMDHAPLTLQEKVYSYCLLDKKDFDDNVCSLQILNICSS